LKFRGARRVADAMAAQIVASAPASVLALDAPAGLVVPGPPIGAGDALTLVPVPLHQRRLRARGYNQAALIAAAVASRTALPLADPLVRVGPATAQVGRHRSERRAGPAGAIEARAAAPPRVLLVDDVVTTGATLAACSAALAAAGAVEIAAVTFARTLGR
jgi:predicted amidophosphoribosyltransferase